MTTANRSCPVLTVILTGLAGVVLGVAGAYLGLVCYFAKNRH